MEKSAYFYPTWRKNMLIKITKVKLVGNSGVFFLLLRHKALGNNTYNPGTTKNFVALCNLRIVTRPNFFIG
jgi:hypothetical protein